jgi:hypothetical protein
LEIIQFLHEFEEGSLFADNWLSWSLFKRKEYPSDMIDNTHPLNFKILYSENGMEHMHAESSEFLDKLSKRSDDALSPDASPSEYRELAAVIGRDLIREVFGPSNYEKRFFGNLILMVEPISRKIICYQNVDDARNQDHGLRTSKGPGDGKQLNLLITLTKQGKELRECRGSGGQLDFGFPIPPIHSNTSLPKHNLPLPFSQYRVFLLCVSRDDEGKYAGAWVECDGLTDGQFIKENLRFTPVSRERSDDRHDKVWSNNGAEESSKSYSTKDASVDTFNGRDFDGLLEDGINDSDRTAEDGHVQEGDNSI